MEDSIIDELYNAKCDDFEGNIMQEEKGCNKNLDLILSSFKKIQKIVPKDISVNVSDELDNIYINILKYFTFWTKKYYKLGIKDGVKLKQEVKMDYRQRKEKEKHFLIDYESDFNDFLEDFRVNILYKNKEYAKTFKELKNILNKYPRVKEFYEDNKLYEFKDEELKSFLEIIRLEGIIYGIETREAFYLGITQNEII